MSFTKNKLYCVLVILFCLVPLYTTGCFNTSSEKGKPHIIIEGSGVAEEIQVSLLELKNMHEEIVEDRYFSLNTYGTEEYFHFKGVWVWGLLQEKVSLRAQAAKVSFIAEDGYTVEYTLEEVRRADYIDENDITKEYKMILAWEENSMEYDSGEGSPFRLVVGQKEPGDVNKPLWVRNVYKILIE
jgi:hypothetical protein